MPDQPFKLAFVVEGTTDATVVETLVPRVWSPPPQVHAVRLGGKAAVPWIWSTVAALRDEKHYDHVVVLLDADSTAQDEIEEQHAALWAQLKRHRFTEEEVSVCFAVPELEAWLLADVEQQPERDPRTRFEERFGRRSRRRVEQRASELDIAGARHASSSFDQFVKTLEALREQRERAA